MYNGEVKIFMCYEQIPLFSSAIWVGGDENVQQYVMQHRLFVTKIHNNTLRHNGSYVTMANNVPCELRSESI